MLEELDPSDPRVTLLGDRGDDARALTEEAWRVVHACAVWTLYATRTASRNQSNGRERLKAKAMMRACRKKFEELVQARWRAALRDKRTTQFKEAWIETHAAFFRARGGELKACALSRAPGADASARAAADRACEDVGIEMYTDGACDPVNKQLEAGAGACEFAIQTSGANADGTDNPCHASDGGVNREPTYDPRQAHTSKLGPPRRGRLTWACATQVTQEGEAQGRKTSNTGELTAMLHALQRARSAG